MITLSSINGYFNKFIELPDQNVFSPTGVVALAEWSEQQSWWSEFAVSNSLRDDLQSTSMGERNLFVLNLYSFLNPPVIRSVSTVASSSGLEQREII
jgi:hypothetical protein